MIKKLSLLFCLLSLNLSANEGVNVPDIFKKSVENGGTYEVFCETEHLRFSSLEEKGMKFGWQMIERVQHPQGAALIIAVTENNELILGQQRRIPVQAQVLGLPGGMIENKEKDESVEAVAKRELLEETGYFVELKDLEVVNSAPSSAGLTSELHHLVLAKVAAKNYKQLNLEDAENYAGLRPITIKLSEIDKVLAQKRAEGVLIDNKIYTALYFLKKHGLY